MFATPSHGEYSLGQNLTGGRGLFESIVKAAVERGATDIHIKAGDVFRARIDGKLEPLTKQRLTPDQTHSIALTLVASDEVREEFDGVSDYDCTWGAAGIGRFRVNILKQRSSYMIVLRVIPFEVQSLEKLHLPNSIKDIVDHPNGMVLVAGIGSSGTDDVLAAIVHHINSTSRKHIITLESPIEFLHRDTNSSITQREIGTDTKNLATGLRATLRQDPDVIVVGRPLDHITIESALEAAESGVLVVARVNASSVVGAVNRAVAQFPPEDASIARVRIVDALCGVIAIRKIARADAVGRVSVSEVLVVTEVAGELLGDSATEAQIRSYMEAHTGDFGMRSFRHHAAELVEAGIISEDSACAFDAENQEETKI